MEAECVTYPSNIYILIVVKPLKVEVQVHLTTLIFISLGQLGIQS